MQVSVVTPGTLDAVWEQLAPMIERARQKGYGDEYTMDSLKASVLRGGLQLWVAHEGEDIIAGMIVELVQFPAKRKVFIHMLAGRDMEGWFDERVHLLTAFRDMNNASSIETLSRPGAARFLEKRGWKRKAILMEAP